MQPFSPDHSTRDSYEGPVYAETSPRRLVHSCNASFRDETVANDLEVKGHLIVAGLAKGEEGLCRRGWIVAQGNAR